MTAVPPPLRLYLDEDVDVLLANLLTAHGYDCLTTAAAGRLGSTDEEQLQFAAQDSRILITHNRTDFENLARIWWAAQQDHAGIVLALRRADVYNLARHILPVLRFYDQAGWRNNVLYAWRRCATELFAGLARRNGCAAVTPVRRAMPRRTISLDTIQIASPCEAAWDDMAGTERMRFCHLCQKTVYNLSAMTRAQAEKLILQKEGRACVRLYRRRDGMVLTSDCPVGLRAARRRVALWVGGAAACFLALVAWAGALTGLKIANRPGSRGGCPILNLFDPDPPDCIMGDIAPPEVLRPAPPQPQAGQ